MPRKRVFPPIVDQAGANRVVDDVFGGCAQVLVRSKGVIVKPPLPAFARQAEASDPVGRISLPAGKNVDQVSGGRGDQQMQVVRHQAGGVAGSFAADRTGGQGVEDNLGLARVLEQGLPVKGADRDAEDPGGSFVKAGVEADVFPAGVFGHFRISTPIGRIFRISTLSGRPLDGRVPCLAPQKTGPLGILS